MTWLKLTSEALFLMQGGTNLFLDKVDLTAHSSGTEEFELTVPTKWFQGSRVPRSMVVDVGSIEKPEKAPEDPTFDADAVFSRIIKRKDWNASPPVSRFEIVDRPQFIVIHHTDQASNPSKGTVAGAKQITKDIQTFHMTDTDGDKPWSDIGYNFLNTVGGHLLEGRANSLEEAIRGNSVRGAHAGTADGNRSPGITNEGNFSVNQSMPKAQWDSLVDLCAALCQSCGIDPAKIRGHRDFVRTTCPGDWLYKQLPRLRAEVAQRLSQ